MEIFWYNLKEFYIFESKYQMFNLIKTMLAASLLISVVLLIRKIMIRKNIILRCLLWCFVLLAPFTGYLKLFYNEFLTDNAVYTAVFDFCNLSILAGSMYLLVMILYAAKYIRSNYLLKKYVRTLPAISGGKYKVLQNTMEMTPFTVGFIHPVIVMPHSILHHCTGQEIELIMEHEKMHIRLGHLYIYRLIEVLKVFWWANPLVHAAAKAVRQDLEELCDYATIKKTRTEPIDYGRLILKSLCMLQKGGKEEYGKCTPAFTYEKDFHICKSRLQKIAAYRPYHRLSANVLLMVTVLCMAFGFTCIRENSFPRYTPLTDIYIIDEQKPGEVLVENNKELREAVTYTDKDIRVDGAALMNICEQYGIEEKEISVLFGGYRKQPRYGGGSNYVEIDTESLSAGQNIIPYEDRDSISEFFLWLTKVL